jgi:hypothetical protein
MRLVPDSLDKYFRNKTGQVMKDNDYYTLLNYHLRQQMQLGKVEDVASILVDGSEIPEFFRVTEENCERAFLHKAWSNMRDNERARTVYLFVNKYMKDNFGDLETPALNFIPSRDHKNKPIDGLYCVPTGINPKDYIYINPDLLTKVVGVRVVDVIAHELQHCHDFHDAKMNILPNIKRFYVADKQHAEEEIMNLPLDGLIKNLKTGKYDIITPHLRQQILTAKTRISPIIYNRNFDLLHAVSNERDMFDFLQYIAYRRSPLEQRAYLAGADAVESMLKNFEGQGVVDSYDLGYLNNARKSIGNIANQAEKFTNLTSIHSHEVCDLFSRFNYYSNLAQTNPIMYKSKANELHEKLLNVASFAYSLHYASIEESIRNL